MDDLSTGIDQLRLVFRLFLIRLHPAPCLSRGTTSVIVVPESGVDSTRKTVDAFSALAHVDHAQAAACCSRD